ncbi:MAG TPA: hypothetical protein DCK87_02445 [Desulfotomaculum sp.]|nr:hypothetical protein [Desulfotomaculum sp.]
MNLLGFKREVVEHADCVAVVVLDEQNNVLLVRQFRHATGKFLLEVPAGGIEPEEEPIDCVRRDSKNHKLLRKIRTVMALVPGII